MMHMAADTQHAELLPQMPATISFTLQKCSATSFLTNVSGEPLICNAAQSNSPSQAVLGGWRQAK